MIPYRSFLSVFLFLSLVGSTYSALPNDAVVHVECGVGTRDAGDGVCFHVADGKGYVWTNHHIAGNYSDAMITFPDRRRYVGKVVGYHEGWDLALVVFKCPSDTPSVPLAEVDAKVGDSVTVIGDSSLVTDPIRRGKRIDLIKNTPSRFQSDVTVGSGDSGGAFLNSKGELVGVVSGCWPEDPKKQGLGADLEALKAFWKWAKERNK